MSGIATAVVGGAIVSGVAASMAAGEQAEAAESAAATSAEASRYATDLQQRQYEQARADLQPWRQVGMQGLNQLAYGMGLPGYASTAPGVAAPAVPPAAPAPSVPSSLAAFTPLAGQAAPGPSPLLPGWGLGGESQPGTLILPTTQRADQPASIAAPPATQFVPTGEAGSLMRPFSMADYQADPGYQFRLDEAQRALEGSAAARGMLLSGAQQKGIQRYGQGLASQEYGRAYGRYGAEQEAQFNRLAAMAGVGQTATSQLRQAGSEYAAGAGGLATSSAADIASARLAAGQAQASAYQGWGGALSSAATGLAQYYSQPASRYNAFGTSMWG